MKTRLISDTHFNHTNIATYCDRPPDFTELLVKEWHRTVQPDDLVIHLGDVQIGKKSEWLVSSLPGRKILVRGNHDRDKSCQWWMERGFDFACDGLRFRGCWLTHEPSATLPEGCTYNIHGHLHNIWHGFQSEHDKHREERDRRFYGPDYKHRLKYPWQRLFAVEYTEYRPIDFEEFIAHPDKYQARGPKQ